MQLAEKLQVPDPKYPSHLVCSAPLIKIPKFLHNIMRFSLAGLLSDHAVCDRRLVYCALTGCRIKGEGSFNISDQENCVVLSFFPRSLFRSETGKAVL